jgi:hypothetical protein
VAFSVFALSAERPGSVAGPAVSTSFTHYRKAGPVNCILLFGNQNLRCPCAKKAWERRMTLV